MMKNISPLCCRHKSRWKRRVDNISVVDTLEIVDTFNLALRYMHLGAGFVRLPHRFHAMCGEP